MTKRTLWYIFLGLDPLYQNGSTLYFVIFYFVNQRYLFSLLHFSFLLFSLLLFVGGVQATYQIHSEFLIYSNLRPSTLISHKSILQSSLVHLSVINFYPLHVSCYISPSIYIVLPSPEFFFFDLLKNFQDRVTCRRNPVALFMSTSVPIFWRFCSGLVVGYHLLV